MVPSSIHSITGTITLLLISVRLHFENQSNHSWETFFYCWFTVTCHIFFYPSSFQALPLVVWDQHSFYKSMCHLPFSLHACTVYVLHQSFSCALILQCIGCRSEKHISSSVHLLPHITMSLKRVLSPLFILHIGPDSNRSSESLSVGSEQFQDSEMAWCALEMLSFLMFCCTRHSLSQAVLNAIALTAIHICCSLPTCLLDSSWQCQCKRSLETITL